MREAQPVRVQELPLEPEVASARRTARRRRPEARSRRDARGSGACGRSRAERRGARASASSSPRSNHVTASRGSSVSSDRRVGIAAVPADRRVDPPASRARAPAHEREVAALDLARPDRRLERRVRVLRARDDEEARGVAVEPVDDPRPLRIVAARRAEREELRRRASPTRLRRPGARSCPPACRRRPGARPRTRWGP